MEITPCQLDDSRISFVTRLIVAELTWLAGGYFHVSKTHVNSL